MSAPGWYPDPQGQGMRWWDGLQWTQHQQMEQQVLDIPIGRDKRFYADSTVIRYGRKSLAREQITYVAYWATHNYSKVGLGIKMSAGSEWNWMAGAGRQQIWVTIRRTSQNEDDPTWSTLVDFTKRNLEPPLLARLVASVRSGHPTDVGDGLTVHLAGLATSKGRHVAMTWPEFAGTRNHKGRVFIYRHGTTEPAISLPHQNPNAVLIPAFLEAVRKAG